MIRDHQVVIVGGPKQDGGWPPFKKTWNRHLCNCLTDSDQIWHEDRQRTDR